MKQPSASWKKGDPAALGFSVESLATFDGVIKSEFPTLFSVVLIRKGELAYEWYRPEVNDHTPLHLYSVTKSVTSTLIGHALGAGTISSLDMPIADILPDYVKPDADPRCRKVTIRHLLTMTSGFAYDMEKVGIGFPRLAMAKDVLSGPFAHEPGEFFQYDDAGPHLLSHALQRITGMTEKDYAVKYLFEPLGIRNFAWGEDEDGFTNASFMLMMSGHAIAKLPQLYLNGGVWGEVRILPESFVREATTPQNGGGWPANVPYGYLWWTFEEKGLPIFSGLGYGGQYCMGIPALDLVCIILADEQLGAERSHEPRRLVSDHIIPAIKK